MRIIRDWQHALGSALNQAQVSVRCWPRAVAGLGDCGGRSGGADKALTADSEDAVNAPAPAGWKVLAVLKALPGS